MSEFSKRTLSGIIFVAIIITSILYNQYTFILLFSVISIICVKEYINIAKIFNASINKLLTYSSTVFILLLYFLCKTEIFSNNLLYLATLPFILILIIEVFKNDINCVQNASMSLITLNYAVLPFAMTISLAFIDKEYNPIIILSTFALIWTNDTGAYLSGIKFGKHKLAPKLSPKKSIEGFAGGIVFTILVAIVLHLFLLDKYSLFDMIVIALIVSIFGTIGDLFESMLKRRASIKDSGTLMPGHGGALDRFDSFIFVIPIVNIYMHLIKF